VTATPSQVILVIDALGWDLAARTAFLADRLPHRRRLRTGLGYSAAVIPSLLTGVPPREHGHWFLFHRAVHPGDSPFRGAGLMARLPRRIRERYSLRMRLGEWWRRSAGIRGYFHLYEVPYRELKDLDYTERRDTWKPGTFACGSYLDDLAARGLEPHVSDWRIPDDAKLDAALARAQADPPAGVFLIYLTEIDALQHAHGNDSPVVDGRLLAYRDRLRRLEGILAARGPVSLTVCSDHGMTNVTRVADPGPLLQATGLSEGRDYRVFIDSTFLRLWTNRPAAEGRLRECLAGLDWGRLLDRDELEREGVDFPDNRYGDLIVLAHPGVLICPSYMGRSPISGMHGYAPDDPASDAVLLRGVEDSPAPRSILELRRLFLADLAAAGTGP
jgi:hypothetical protein